MRAGRASAVVEFDHVWHVYPGGSQALVDVSLSIREGEVVALVGPNGSGKTTLLKHINGLLKPTRGTVKVAGLDTRRASVGRLSRHVGLIFQSPRSQLFARTALEEAAFGPRNFRIPDPLGAAARALRAMGLEGYEGRSPLSLSGGEQKRLSIAASTSWGPRIIAMDEPTVGQDLRNKMRLLGAIRLWSRAGIATILASHDVEFLWLLGPRAIVMSQGRVLADGPAREVLSDEALMARAALRPPQLAELGKLLRAPRAIGSVWEAVAALAGEASERGSGA